MAEIAVAIPGLKSGKDVGEDEIRTEQLKALHEEGVRWLKMVCQMAWKPGKIDSQTGVIIYVYWKADCKKTNHQRKSLFGFSAEKNACQVS